jgi:hypothetical protein
VSRRIDRLTYNLVSFGEVVIIVELDPFDDLPCFGIVQGGTGAFDEDETVVRLRFRKQMRYIDLVGVAAGAEPNTFVGYQATVAVYALHWIGMFVS